MQKAAAALPPTVLTIAGSDPSGGAGIQADLKTMTVIGVYGAAAITCITVQNSLGVTESVPLDEGLVVRQAQAVLTDHRVTHIKIGMVGAIRIAGALGRMLTGFDGEVIYDPVLASTTGQSLLNCGDSADLSPLLSRVTVLTPNGDELAQLCRQTITSTEEALGCAGILLDRYQNLRAVIVKGGHLEAARPEIRDFLVLRAGEVITSKRTRIENVNLHGTGCTFASAFAAFHCRENDYRRAFLLTTAFMDDLIRKSRPLSLTRSGRNGPLAHFVRMREITV